MNFHHPSVWMLLLLVLIPLIWRRWIVRNRRRVIGFSSVATLRSTRSSWAAALHWLPAALRSAAIILLIVCLARPQDADEHTRVYTEGIAIQLIVDRSGSMQAMDFQIDNERVDRLTAVKEVVRDFILGVDDLPGRPDDLIGLIAFGTWADALCPLTLDHDFLAQIVDSIQIPSMNAEQNTAIGDALALAVERLRRADQNTGENDAHVIKSKIIVLLTDGENTAGELDPLTAADLAATFGIKVYTIGAGSQSGYAPFPRFDPFRSKTRLSTQYLPMDEATLEAVAERTGGEYFRASDTEALKNVYARIDELERTEIEQRRYTDYKELSVESFRLFSLNFPPLLSIVFVLLTLDMLLRFTRFQRLP